MIVRSKKRWQQAKHFSLMWAKLLFLSFALASSAGCRGLGDDSKVQDSDAASSQTTPWDPSQFPPLSEADGMNQTVQNILGLPTGQKDGNASGHAGLIDMARLLGYNWPGNDCGSDWVYEVDGSGASLSLRTYSPHTGDLTVHGAPGASSSACNNQYTNQPVAYTFSNWTATSQVQKVAIQPTDPAADPSQFQASAPPATVSSGATVNQGQVTVTDNGTGSMVFDAPDVVQMTCCEGDATVSGGVINLQYSRAIATQHITTMTHTSSLSNSSMVGFSSSQEVGVTLGNAEAGAQFSAGVSFTESNEQTTGTSTSSASADQTGTTTTVTRNCQVSIPVTNGCVFNVTLTAHYRETRSSFNTLLKLNPLTADFNGAVNGASNNQPAGGNGNAPCALRNGTCHGQNVDSNYGSPSDNFADAINTQVTHGGDQVWRWDTLAGPPPTGLDADLTFLQGQNYGGFTLTGGSDTLEEISSCEVSVTYVSGPTGTCQTPDVSNPDVTSGQ